MASSDALLHRRDVLPGDGAAHDLVDELEALAALERLDADRRHAELAVAAGLLLVLALGLGLLGDGLAVGDEDVLGRRPPRRTCGPGARPRRPDGSRPCRAGWSGASRRPARRRGRGSSSWRRCSPVMSLSSSPLDLGRMATDSDHRLRAAATGTTTGVPLGARVSPVAVSESLGTATMSPGLGLARPAGPPCPAGAAGRGAARRRGCGGW